MEFKAGDKIRVKRGRSNCSVLCHAKIRTIREVHSTYLLISCDHGGIYLDEAILIRNLPRTEVEILDCIKENFKEGV